MKRKLSLWATSAVMLLATQSAFATDLYVGGSLGLSIPQVRFGSDQQVSGEHHHTVGGSTSFLGGVFVGVDHTWCDLGCFMDLYTALEFNVRYNSFDQDIARHTDLVGVSNFRATVKSPLQYGLDFKFGIPVDCCGTTPYLLVGVEAARFENKIHNDSAVFVRGIPPFSSRNFHKTRTGANVGGGVRFRVMECVDMDVQYSYTWYGHRTTTLIDPTVTVAPTSWRHKSRLEENRVLVSLSFPLWDLSTWF